ncbi:MAG: hypothetical protein H7Y28_14495 [Rhodoferax sp.]|nr:hypothetical protein [Rhodoferax sp.]
MALPKLALTPIYLAATLLVSTAFAQTKPQVVNPPKTILWMDVSTGGMAGMPEIDIPGMGNLMGGLMGAMGKSSDAKSTGKEYYGMARTFHIMPPRIVDVALWNGLKPGVESAQRIPAGMKLGDKLPLLPVIPDRVSEVKGGVDGYDYEPPKGRLLFYWGCGTAVRTGQPRILDLSKLSADSMQAFGNAFSGRFAPDRGAKVKPGYDVFPNERDKRGLPKGASLVGDHQIVGDGVPESFKFTLGAAHDVMPPIELQSRGGLKDSIALEWAAVTNAKAYFLNAMAMQGEDMIFWSSSELPDSGFGLFDYLSNANIDKWVKDKVLLASSVSKCAVPKGIFDARADTVRSNGRDGGGAFLRMVAYGGEHGFVHPPRPTDVKIPWDQEWSVRLRVKSQTMAMLGEDISPDRTSRDMPQSNAAEEQNREAPKESADKNPLPAAVNLLKGLFGR